MKILKIPILTFVLLLLILSQTACRGEAEPVSKTSYYLDTICQVDIYDMEEDEANRLIDGAFAICSDCEALLSKTKENSDIYELNKKGYVRGDDMTVELIEKGKHYGDVSGGMFDISIGRLTELWDFHAEEPKLPDGEAVKDAVKHVDYHKIKVDDSSGITLTDKEMKVDLGGLAKGYICDRMVGYLEKHGVKSAIVNLGGNISAIGKKGDRPFKVGIEKPFSDRGEMIGYIESDDNTFVTSGTYERCFKIDGKLYHHILDKKTGYPVDTDLESVTVISKNGRSADCDALSTICLMLGSSKAKALIENTEGMEAVFVDKDGKIYATAGSGFVKD